MDGIREMVRDIDEGRAVLMTSVMTKTEVFHKLKTQWAKDEYTRFCQRANVAIIAQDERIADKSSNIREHYTAKGITLGASDCVHLATAILYKADTLYTLDGSGEHPKPNDLLPLNGNVAGESLKIEKPHATQGSLFSGIPRAAVSSAVTPTSRTAAATRERPRRKR